jgi:hypothetical protein
LIVIVAALKDAPNTKSVRFDDSDLVELMAAAQTVDGRAYEDLLQAVAEIVGRISRRRLGIARVDEIDDIVQDVLAAFSPRLTTLLGALAVAGLANFCIRFVHPFDSSFVVLTWHVGAVMALAAAFASGGHYAFNWRKVAHGK